VDPYIGQIEAFPYTFAPQNWALCAGQLLPIAQNQALFALIGTQFGGDGITTFALPDLQGRLSVGFGNGQGLTPRVIGETGGEEQHALILAEVPGPHSHAINAVVNGVAGGTDVPGSTTLLASGYSTQAGTPPVNIYGTGGAAIPMGTLATAGGQAHDNRMPFLVLNYCIALAGVFPSRN
jgi:microcystin-dependent protein